MGRKRKDAKKNVLGTAKGQAATETLVLLGFILAMSIPIVLLILTNANLQSEEASIMQAKITTRQISDASNEVWIQGNGSRRLLLVNYPSKLKDINMTSHEITFILESAKGPVEVTALAFATLSDGDNGVWRLANQRPAGPESYIGSGLHAINLTNNGTHVVVTYVQQS